jgi:hypothetical protein
LSNHCSPGLGAAGKGADGKQQIGCNSLEEGENRELREKVVMLSKELAMLSKERNVLMTIVRRSMPEANHDSRPGVNPGHPIQGSHASH